MGTESGELDEIVCPLSKWYFRRIGMLLALTGGLGLYFLYDGAIGYPKKNHVADLYEAFDAVSKGRSWEPEDPAALTEEQKEEIEEARQAAEGGATWAGFAADRLLPEKEPKRYTEADIREQFHFAILMGVICVGLGAFVFARRKKAVRADGEVITLPGGEKIPFLLVRKLDLAKWDRGVAVVTCATESGDEKTVKIDDYKFQGTDAILKRLLEKNESVELAGDRRWLFPGEKTEEASSEGNREKPEESPGSNEEPTAEAKDS